MPEDQFTFTNVSRSIGGGVSNPSASLMPSSAPMDDSELFDRICQGDESAFDELFKRWYPRLVRLGEAITRERGLAEEVVQDVMLEIWRRGTIAGTPESVPGYLMQSVRNRALNQVRRRKVERSGEPRILMTLNPPVASDARAVEQELDVAVKAAIAELPDRCREIFELSRVQGLKYAEIADALGISVKTVENQMGTALKRLRDRLAPWLPGSTIGPAH